MQTVNPILPRTSPESVGLSSSQIQKFIEELQSMSQDNVSQEVHSFMVLRHGKVLAEGCFEPYQQEAPHMLFSLSKSFTSTAIGIAQTEGYLSIKEPVSRYLSADFPVEVSDYLKSLTIEHLLMMASGHEKEGMEAVGRLKKWTKAMLSANFDHEPGSKFMYNTGATYLLSSILQKATGQTLLAFLKPRLLDPLGITEADWEISPEGIHMGGFGLSISVESIAKFGQLYLNQGVWEGKQLVESSWVQAATAKQIANGEEPDNDWGQGYGYQFWQCTHGAYRGDGAFGQFCIVLPKLDMVVAVTSGANDMGVILKKVWACLLPEEDILSNGSKNLKLNHQEDALALDATSYKVSLAYQPLVGEKYSPIHDALHLQSYQISPKAPMFSQIQFFCPANNFMNIILHKAQSRQTIRIGYQEWLTSEVVVENKKTKVAASGVWTTPNQLSLLVRYIETPFVQKMVLDFNEKGFQMHIEDNVSFGSKTSFSGKGKRIKSHYVEQINQFMPSEAQEVSDKAILCKAVEQEGDLLLTRENAIYHITSSGFIMNAQLDHVLMIHHNIYNTWTWTGGHADGDSDLLAIAIKEAREETGLKDIVPLTGVIDTLDILPVNGHFKRGKYVSAHLHMNVAYVLIASTDHELTVNEQETSDVKWVPADEISSYSNEPEIVRVYEKLIKRAKAFLTL